MMRYRGEFRNKFDIEDENIEEFVENILDEIEDDVNDILGLLEDYKLEQAMNKLREMFEDAVLEKEKNLTKVAETRCIYCGSVINLYSEYNWSKNDNNAPYVVCNKCAYK